MEVLLERLFGIKLALREEPPEDPNQLPPKSLGIAAQNVVCTKEPLKYLLKFMALEQCDQVLLAEGLVFWVLLLDWILVGLQRDPLLLRESAEEPLVHLILLEAKGVLDFLDDELKDELHILLVPLERWLALNTLD